MAGQLDRTAPQVSAGVFVGLVLGVLAVAVLWLTELLGADASDLVPGITIEEQTVLFMAGGLAGGVLGGVLFPLTRWVVGRWVYGMSVLLPYLAGQWWLADPSYAGLAEYAITLVLLGAFIGYLDWRHQRHTREQNGEIEVLKGKED